MSYFVVLCWQSVDPGCWLHEASSPIPGQMTDELEERLCGFELQVRGKPAEKLCRNG